MAQIVYIFRMLFLVVILQPIHARAESPASWTLLSHIHAPDSPALTLTPEQQNWLQHKRVLNIGIRVNDAPPYSLRTINHEYEGLSADYLAIVAARLNLKVNVVRYERDELLWRALARGEIDLIPSITAFPPTNSYISSAAYAAEQPLIAIRSTNAEPLPADLADKRVAMAADYLPLDVVKAVYPKARFQIYDTYQEALSAVAFNNAQVYIGNSYPVVRNYLNNLRIERVAKIPARKIVFALRRSDTILHTLINQILAEIPQGTEFRIQQYWQTGVESDLLHISQPLVLSADEQKWVKEHPVVKVLIYGRDNFAPVAFFDQYGEVHGIALDVLAWVGLKTGLRFSFKRGDTIDGILKEVNTRQADMIAVLAPSRARQEQINFSYPYNRSAFVLVTGTKKNNITDLADLRGKTLAVVKQAALADEIKARYPEIRLVYYGNDDEMFNSVATGKTDALVSIVITADYKINKRFRDELKIVNTIGGDPAYLSFGVGKADPELLSILDKILRSTPPDQLEILANRWRPNNMVVIDSFWQRNRVTLTVSGLVTAIILLMTLARLLWLRKQMNRAELARKRVTEQLRMLEKLVEGLPFPMALRNREGRLIYCNQLYVERTSLTYDQLQGRTLVETPPYLQADEIDFWHNQIMDSIKYDRPFSVDREYTLLHQDTSEEKAAHIWLTPWHDEQGNVVGVITGMWDISERLKLLRNLSEATEKAEEANRSKSTFLSTMSHEIRTPMNAVIGMLDMAIKSGREGKHDLQALEVAHEAAEGLIGLVGDILDLSRIEGGHLEFNPGPLNLGNLINQLMVIFNGLALDKNILLNKTFPSEPIVDVIGDSLRIKQVLSNILSNAIKFTDYGGVHLHLEQIIDTEKRLARYVISVKDSGVGIPAEQQKALFKPFAQADNRRAGTGLGLYISRTLCMAMSGGLTLSSVLHEGTLVRAEFELELANSSVKNVTKNAAVPVTEEAALKVLVIDDNAANRILMAKQLAWLGHHSHAAADATEGFLLWQQHEFDVLITDCNMPNVNGYQLTQRIRDFEKDNGQKPIWIFGFTANAMQEVVERCLNAGMNGCLFKPCSIEMLAKALNEFSEQNK